MEALEDRVFLSGTDIAPAVASFRVNDGSAQRAMVDSVTVTFTEPVTLAAGAISLVETATNSGLTPGPAAFQTASPDGGTTYVLTFPQSSFPADIGNSLRNGTYNLTINAAAVTDAAGTAMQANQHESFYRLYGDFSGQGEVDFFNGFVPIAQADTYTLARADLPWYYSSTAGNDIEFPEVVAVAQDLSLGFQPTASLQNVSVATAGLPLTISASASSSDSNGDALTYQWSITDPTGAAVALPNGGITAGPSITFTPAFHGNWTVTLAVTDTNLSLKISTSATEHVFSATYITPPSNPTLPGGMDPFNPPAINPSMPGPGVPAIAASDLIGGPDQSLTITGSNLTGSSINFLVYGQTTGTNGSLTSALIQNSSANGDTITISANAPANSMYMVWPQATTANGIVYGEPIELNKTDPTWIGPQTANLGQTVSVYGRNLSNGAATPLSWVYLQPATGQGEWAQVTAVNPYKVNFTVPSDLTVGQAYTVWINNGLGGVYSWAQAPGTLTISAPYVWASPGAPQYLNVKNGVTIQGVFYPGATGNGVTDDGPAIAAALLYIQNFGPNSSPGAVLYFPAGTYVVNGEQLVVPSNTRIVGAGPSQTTLLFTALPAPTVASPFVVPGEIATEDGGFTTNVEFDSIGLTYTGPADSNNSLVRERYGADFTFNNVWFNAGTLASLDWQGSAELTLENCQLIEAAPVALIAAHDATITNCSFFLENYCEESMTVWGGYDIAMTNNTMQNYNNASPTGVGWDNFVEDDLTWGSIYNEYFAGNNAINMGINYPNANEGTLFGSEGAQEHLFGTALSGGANTVTLLLSAEQSIPPKAGDQLIVTAGTGLGQMETIQSVTVSGQTVTITIAGVWNVIPDSTSHIEAGTTWYNNVGYDNTYQVQANQMGANFGNSVGFEPWQGAYGVVFDDNTVINAFHGVLLASADIDNPCFFLSITNNRIDDSQMNSLFDLAPPDVKAIAVWPQLNSGDASDVGVVISNNTIISPRTDAFDIGSPVSNSATALMVIEHNTITNTPVGISATNDPGVLFYKNTFDNSAFTGTASVAADFNGNSNLVVLNSNTYLNFTQTYAGSVPSALLQIPFNSYSITVPQGTSQSLAILLSNAGASPLTWTAATTTPGLSFAASSGTIAPETSGDFATLNINASVAGSGTYTLMLTSGSQVKAVTLVLTVS